MKVPTLKKVTIIHTSFISVDTLTGLFSELAPEVEVHHIVDDSMLPEIMAAGGVTSGVIKRFCAYAVQAEAAGADLIFSQCSSAGLAADTAEKMLRIPLLKVDQAMAEEAVALGEKIAVVATIGTTLEPSVKLIEQTAQNLGKHIQTVSYLLTDAYEALFLRNDPLAHNAIIIEKIREIEKDCDVIVLAQGSMVSLLDELDSVSIPLLTSPKLGVVRAKEMLGL